MNDSKPLSVLTISATIKFISNFLKGQTLETQTKQKNKS